jgi:hypothetical protein
MNDIIGIIGLLLIFILPLCLNIIYNRKGRFRLGLLSSKFNAHLDHTDKCLLFLGAIFFLLGVLLLSIGSWGCQRGGCP